MLLSVAITALVALASTAWAGPQGGGGGGHFGGGGFSGGHGGGGFRGGQFGGFGAGHFGSAGVTSFNRGGIRAAPTFSGGGARFSAPRNVTGLSRTPQQFSYYSGARTSAVMPRASARQLPNRSIGSNAGRPASVNRQSNRVTSAVGQRRITNARFSTAGSRQSFVKNHAFARHESNWHRDWDKHRAHFDHGHVFVFVGGPGGAFTHGITIPITATAITRMTTHMIIRTTIVGIRRRSSLLCFSTV